ncbi:dTDP-glucose 4,6-dehydratase [Sphaerisporangium krabiense]|uniref:dTDP-glucose 4,6-dehydratase n=1 Tax=Sphaerisporangium krabiense TaxID=763782 RepID=A0A7W9DTF5_9ACTN|nr:dTDP-glucose 4,6-dehydratase [Sphaerisporangium krabiense]MBB5630578.1 dTDP-glucose 4,6-dehydratase [Sphaerisporangium krabiense]GII62469.1 dTDP-glucose 4,6-dehydratase [Sphaerisporangium krabiense]
MRILVTGGAGFIGSHYVRALLTGAYPGYEDARVTVLDKLTYAGNPANLAPVASSPRFTFVRGDIADPRVAAGVVPGHDVVVNFAAETHVDRSITGAADFVLSNVLGTQTLLQAALDAGVRTVVQVSTDEVYGSIDEGAWDEDEPLLPNSPYSAAKAGADLLCRAYHRTYGLDVRVTRCSNNYGPYQYPEKLIPLVVTNLLDGDRVPLYGDGLNVREWLHVDDHCRAVRLVLEKGAPGEVYNVGGGVELTNRALVGMLLEACDAGWDVVDHVTDRPGHDRRYSVDSGKIRSIGYEPLVRFDQGLGEVVRWYTANQAWWRPLKRRSGGRA